MKYSHNISLLDIFYRADESTQKLADLQNELIVQRKKNAMLEKQIGKSKIEQANNKSKGGKDLCWVLVTYSHLSLCHWFSPGLMNLRYVLLCSSLYKSLGCWMIIKKHWTWFWKTILWLKFDNATCCIFPSGVIALLNFEHLEHWDIRNDLSPVFIVFVAINY